MADYTMPVPTWTTGEEVTSAKLNLISGDLPFVQDFPAFSVASTLVATDLLQGAFVVPANQMGSNRHLLLWAEGTLKNNTGAGQAPPAFSVLYGASTLLDTNLGNHNLTAAAALGQFELFVRIQMSNATNAQEITIWGEWSDGNDNNQFTTGRGIYDTIGAAKGGSISGRNTTAVDMAAGATLALKARCSVSSANYVVALTAAKAWIL